MKVPHEIWLAGKGPSFDVFNWAGAGPCRIGINEAAFLIPECWGAIANDPPILSKYVSLLPEHITVFRYIHYPEFQFPKQYAYDVGPEQFVKETFSTATCALQLFAGLGAEIVHFIGFDSIDGRLGYAETIKHIRGEGVNDDGFKAINKRLLEDVIRLGINPIWEHRNVARSRVLY